MFPRRTEGFCWLEAIVSPGNFWKLAVVWGVGQADGVLPGSAGSVKQFLDPASLIPRPLLFFFPTQLTASSRRQVDTTFLGDDIAQEPVHPSSEGLRAQHDCSLDLSPFLTGPSPWCRTYFQGYSVLLTTSFPVGSN